MGTDKRERKKAGRQARLEAARTAQQQAKRRRTIRNFVIVGVVVLAGLVIFARQGGGGGGSKEETTGTSVVTGRTPCPEADGSSPRVIEFARVPPTCIDPDKRYTATFHTSEGAVTIRLDTKTTPKTTNNFVVLARYGYYDDTELFRTDTSIGIIQGGSPQTNDPSDPGPGYSIADEGGKFDWKEPGGKGPFTYGPGELVMARTAQPDGSGAQFFFTVNDDAANLDSQGTYLKFGQVTKGLDVLERILGLNVEDPQSGLGGRPGRTVTIEEVSIRES